MPHIKYDQKMELAKLQRGPLNAGELNYELTCVVLTYLMKHKLCYQTINDIAGALTQALAVFNERVTHPYEEIKARENGDVYLHVDLMLGRMKAGGKK